MAFPNLQLLHGQLLVNGEDDLVS